MSLHINCLDWIVPRGNTAEGSRRGEGFSCEDPASWIFYTTVAEEGHRGGRKPGSFPQIPKDSQEAGIIIWRHSPLIEMSPCPPAPLWLSWQGIFLWALQTGEESIRQTTATGQVPPASPGPQCQDAECQRTEACLCLSIYIQTHTVSASSCPLPPSVSPPGVILCLFTRI